MEAPRMDPGAALAELGRIRLDEVELDDVVKRVAELANRAVPGSAAVPARQMQEAMRSRAVIEQAKGIIMDERRCSADEAFTLLAKISQDTNRKLREVAEALVANAADR